MKWSPDSIWKTSVCIVCMCRCIGMLVCAGQKLMLRVFLNHSTPYFLRQNLSLNLALWGSAKLAGEWAPKVFLPLPLRDCDCRHKAPQLLDMSHPVAVWVTLPGFNSLCLEATVLVGIDPQHFYPEGYTALHCSKPSSSMCLCLGLILCTKCPEHRKSEDQGKHWGCFLLWQ